MPVDLMSSINYAAQLANMNNLAAVTADMNAQGFSLLGNLQAGSPGGGTAAYCGLR